jgi:PAS domain S-box-containing protein
MHAWVKRTHEHDRRPIPSDVGAQIVRGEVANSCGVDSTIRELDRCAQLLILWGQADPVWHSKAQGLGPEPFTCDACRNEVTPQFGSGRPVMTVPAQNLHDALDAMDVALLIQGPASEIVYANRVALELLGRPREEVIGRSSFDPEWDVTLPDGRPFPARDRPVATALRTKEPVTDVVLGVLRPNKTERAWLLVAAIPELDDRGGVRQVVVTLQNITRERARLNLLAEAHDQLQRAADDRAIQLTAFEQQLGDARAQRRQAVDALAEREALYASVVGVMSEGVVVYGRDGEVRTCNAAAERILGMTCQQMAGPGHWNLVDPNGTPLKSNEFPSEITATTQESCRNVLIGLTRGTDGQRAWLRVNTDAIVGSEGLQGVAATFADVTAERQAHDELAESRAMFQRVTEATPGVLYQLTQRGRDQLLFASGRVEEFFGVTAHDAQRDVACLYARVHDDDRNEILFPDDGLTATGATWENEFRVARSDGSWRWLRCRAVAEVRDEGTIWTGVIIDVTRERRFAERLQHSQRREAIGDLTAGVAHNFNNVLAAILPNLEELVSAAPEELRGTATDALKAARGAADVVRRLMRFTRHDPTTPLGPVDVAVVCKEVVNLCRRSFDSRISVDLQIATNRSVVRARSAELHQVLLNLCINARDALVDQVDPEVSIALSEVVDGDEYNIVVEVADNGCGMSQLEQQRLGEPFYTTKAPGQGTGLGLAMAFSIVQDMGASMTCRSAVDRGTTFELFLRAIDEAASEVAPSPLQLTRAHLEGLAVLVVDDDELVRRAVVRHLRRQGLQVEQAADGISAMNKFRSMERVDAVILDLSMPGASGEEVLASIRTAKPDVPVIIVTGYVSKDAALGEAYAVLVKPVDLDSLIDVLHKSTHAVGSTDESR